MKKTKIKCMVILIIALTIISIIKLPVTANSENEKIILKKAEKEFIIYYKDLCNNEFQFAISKDKNTKEENLEFTNSVKDQLTENSLNVAYIDETLFDKVFSNNNIAYIWLKDEKDNTLIEANKIDLNNVLDNKMVDFVNNVTKKINVDTTKKYETIETIDDVKTTVTVGKVEVKEKENATYYYKLVKADDTNSKEKELFKLAEKIEQGTTNTYESLKLTNEFYKLYNDLVPTVDAWKKVNNSEILQPETARNGDKYIVWLKEVNNNEEVIDAKFLVSVYGYTKDYKKEDKIITETVKLPVTYDSVLLIVVFAIIVLAIIIVFVLKVKSDKKRK